MFPLLPRQVRNRYPPTTHPQTYLGQHPTMLLNPPLNRHLVLTLTQILPSTNNIPLVAHSDRGYSRDMSAEHSRAWQRLSKQRDTCHSRQVRPGARQCFGREEWLFQATCSGLTLKLESLSTPSKSEAYSGFTVSLSSLRACHGSRGMADDGSE